MVCYQKKEVLKNNEPSVLDNIQTTLHIVNPSTLIDMCHWKGGYFATCRRQTVVEGGDNSQLFKATSQPYEVCKGPVG